MHCRPYLYGRKFTIITDHKPLVWRNSIRDPASRIWKWKLKLSDFEFDIQYKEGRMNANADALSRNLPEVYLPIKKRRDDSPYRYAVKRSFRFDASTEDSSCESSRKYNTRKKGKPETPGKYLERASASAYQSTDEEIPLCYNTRKNRRKQDTPTRHLEQA
jgi:hypothetical protein